VVKDEVEGKTREKEGKGWGGMRGEKVREDEERRMKRRERSRSRVQRVLVGVPRKNDRNAGRV
jgi:hypothetical protein